MNRTMYLTNLKDFTPEVALNELKSYMSKAGQSHIRLSTKKLNLITNGICDSNMIKYVVSIGDSLYQIVAIDSMKMNDDERVSVAVNYTQLHKTKRCSKEFSMKLKNFSASIALNFLKECLHESHSTILSLNAVNKICNGIRDKNMVKYVVSHGYWLYNISAIKGKNKNSITVVVDYCNL